MAIRISKLFAVMIAWLATLFIVLFAAVRAFGAEGTVPRIATVSRATITSLTYQPIITVTGGTGGPRDFVGIYASGANDATRIRCGEPALDCWQYLDGSKVVVATRNLTTANLMFKNVPAGSFEARYYQWMPDGKPALILWRGPVVTPAPTLDYNNVLDATLQRFPVGAQDDVVISRSDGGEDHILVDRGIVIHINKVSVVTAPATETVP